MGEIRVDVTLTNERDLWDLKKRRIRKKDVRSVTLNAVVDTGAVMLLLPQDAVEALGLEKVGRVAATLANEQKFAFDVARTALLTIGKREMPTDCLVGPPGCTPLVGQLVMERLDLIVDPLKRTIAPRPESPFMPTLNLK